MPGNLTYPRELEAATGGTFRGPGTIDQLSRSIEAGGNGARGIVAGYRPDGTGHFFNVVNDGGTVRFIDGQIGRPADVAGGGYYPNRFLLMRTDVLP